MRKVRVERLQGLDHMTVAQVPRRHASAKHGAVILLGVLHQARILFCIKVLIRFCVSGVVRRSARFACELDEPGRHFIFA